MAYNFLGLVNDVNQRLNEVPLTESNFVSASGFYSDAKNAVNNAIREINSKEYQWTFNHRVGVMTLSTDGTTRYPFPTDTKVVDFDTFRLRTQLGDFDPDDFNSDDFAVFNTTGQGMKYLRQISYDKFVRRYHHLENNINALDEPDLVFQTQDRKIGIVPPADKKYAVEFEYWLQPVSLVNYQDVPSIPEAERWVIHEGSMYYAYMFRGDPERAALSNQRFREGIAQMRNIYINKMNEVTTSRRVP